MRGDISPVTMVQGDFFEPVATSNARLMEAIDELNSRFGREMIKLSSGEFQGDWGMRLERKPPDYTTDWAQVPAVLNVSFDQTTNRSCLVDHVDEGNFLRSFYSIESNFKIDEASQLTHNLNVKD